MNTSIDDFDLAMAEKTGPSRRVLIVVLPLARLVLGMLAVVVVLGAGAVGYWLAVGQEGVDRLIALTEPPVPIQTDGVIEVPDTIVNLRRDTPSRFMKIGITLVSVPNRRAEVEEAMPRLVDAMQEFLRNLDEDDLDGSAGLHRLRTELKRRFNLLLAPPGTAPADGEPITDVLLRSLLTQ